MQIYIKFFNYTQTNKNWRPFGLKEFCLHQKKNRKLFVTLQASLADTACLNLSISLFNLKAKYYESLRFRCAQRYYFLCTL